MKISEMIKDMEQIKAEFGDVDISAISDHLADQIQVVEDATISMAEHTWFGERTLHIDRKRKES